MTLATQSSADNTYKHLTKKSKMQEFRRKKINAEQIYLCHGQTAEIKKHQTVVEKHEELSEMRRTYKHRKQIWRPLANQPCQINDTYQKPR